MTPDPVLCAAGVAAAMIAAVVLHRAWRTTAARARLTVTGWALAALSIGLLALGAGFDAGPVIAVLVLGLTAYGLVARGVDVRRNPQRKRREPAATPDSLDPQQRPMRWARASLRCATAVVLAATAAIALAAAWSLHGPGSAADRVVLAAYALPVIWGGAISWALSDERLTRPVAGLALMTAAGAALTLLPGGAA